nr:DEAD-box ATP-dependent RNA helicase 32 [Tanacetum cinerariifolium]
MFSFNLLCSHTTRILKKKKLKINVHKPVGTRVVSDEKGNTLPQLGTLADTGATDSALINKNKVLKRFAELREDMQTCDSEDKLLDRKRRKNNKIKKKEKHKKARDEVEDEMDQIKTLRMSKVQ